uniref:NADH dehydrogenase subunit 2 n=1 Tax=Sporochnus bolleanus TaxID=461143 RepID=UPI002E78E609|nr:NADH dehydrogenase subunit 2 [Sporochnus bolleanus]WBP70342.1 NADH dehydrogenase subunit 2 [Sporochnus bolleanus]
MNFSLMYQNDIAGFLPELFLAISVLVVLLHGSFLSVRAAYLYTYLTPSMVRLTSTVLFLSLLLVLNNPVEGQTLWNAIFITDHLTILSKAVVFLGLLSCVLVSEVYLFSARFRAYEFFVFIISIGLSLCLLISSYDLISIYLSMEFLSLIFYVLAAWKKNSYFSAEAGLKYFILGSVASVFYLFGASLIYYGMGTTNLGSLALITKNLGSLASPLACLSLICIISALLFKIGAAPYHSWVADVYEGAPTLVSFIFAVVPKFGIFVVILRIAFISFWSFFPYFWESFFCLCGLFSVFIGCLGGLGERKIKRLLAFSSIGHVGFLCLGLASGSIEGIQAVLFYLIIYMLTSTFLWVYALHLELDIDGTSNTTFLTFSDAIGLSRANPLLGLGSTLMIFSLAGIPPLGGFFAKFNIFIGLVGSYYYAVTIFVVLTSVVSAFYYIRLIKIIYFEKNKKLGFFCPFIKGISISLGFNRFKCYIFYVQPQLILFVNL